MYLHHKKVNCNLNRIRIVLSTMLNHYFAISYSGNINDFEDAGSNSQIKNYEEKALIRDKGTKWGKLGNGEVQRLVVQEKAVQIMPAKNSPRSYQIPHRNIRQRLLQNEKYS